MSAVRVIEPPEGRPKPDGQALAAPSVGTRKKQRATEFFHVESDVPESLAADPDAATDRSRGRGELDSRDELEGLCRPGGLGVTESTSMTDVSECALRR